LISNIATYSASLADAQDTLRQKNDAEALLQQEEGQINSFLATLANTRASDNAGYQNRLANSQVLIAGIDKTSELFQTSLDNQELDQTSVNDILSLLQNIGASLDASIADDTKAENQAESQYNDFVANRNQRLAEIDSDVTSLSNDITQLGNQIDQLQGNLAAEQTRKANADDLEASTQTALDDLTDKYDSNKSVRTEQLRLLTLVQTTLTANPDEVQSYLNSD